MKNKLLSHNFNVDLYQHCTNQEDPIVKGFKHKLETGYYKLISIPCPICKQNENWTLVAQSKEGFKWSICEGCGLLQNNHRLSHKDLNEFYQSREYFKICMGDLADDKHFELYQNVAGASLALDFRHLGIDLKGLKILDIGCGPGATLLHIKELGANVTGFDIDEKAIEYGKQFIEEIYCGDAFDISVNLNAYDILIVNGVLEHLFDPSKFLEDLHNKLANDTKTKLLIHVPNLDFCFDYNQESFSKFLHISHIWYFNMTNIERCLNQAGFKVESIIPRSANMGILCVKSEKIMNNNNSYQASIGAINFANLRIEGADKPIMDRMTEIYKGWGSRKKKSFWKKLKSILKS